uniref:Uncharacterized protein n=1 Tax=Anguilla anguilla TaxID=7936 RepID=A0A0E9XJ23_ANGAN
MYISIHPLSIPAYPGQGRGGRWSLSQRALGKRPCEYTLDRPPIHPMYIYRYQYYLHLLVN